METLLLELGKARSAGILPAETVRQPAFPWESRRSGFAHRSIRWVRVALPLAAAAVVGFVFVSANLHRPDLSGMTTGPATATSSVLASVQGGAEAWDCNGDGVVNGLDINCYVRQHASEAGATELQTDAFTRRLLGI